MSLSERDAHWVGVKSAYVIPYVKPEKSEKPKPKVVEATDGETAPSGTKGNKEPKKKRPRDDRPEKSDRLCLATMKGEVCSIHIWTINVLLHIVYFFVSFYKMPYFFRNVTGEKNVNTATMFWSF